MMNGKQRLDDLSLLRRDATEKLEAELRALDDAFADQTRVPRTAMTYAIDVARSALDAVVARHAQELAQAKSDHDATVQAAEQAYRTATEKTQAAYREKVAALKRAADDTLSRAWRTVWDSPEVEIPKVLDPSVLTQAAEAVERRLAAEKDIDELKDEGGKLEVDAVTEVGR